ncbi:hypothetical protein D9M68_791420 [compost metagenome]
MPRSTAFTVTVTRHIEGALRDLAGLPSRVSRPELGKVGLNLLKGSDLIKATATTDRQTHRLGSTGKLLQGTALRHRQPAGSQLPARTKQLLQCIGQ